MSSVLDYVKWRGDLSFTQDPPNAVDSVIFSYMVYMKFPKVLEQSDGMTLAEMQADIEKQEDPKQFGNPHQLELLRCMAAAPRFRQAKLVAFRDELIPEEAIQFAAVSLLLDDGSLFAVFRGTDNTLVGWKEDFNMCFQESIPSQHLALSYIRQLYDSYHRPMYICGHSKGGNLAVYAASMSPPEIRQTIRQVYNNDGPGFMEYMLTMPGYLEMVPRIHTYVPQSSIIGLLMEHAEPYRVVKSTQMGGIMQHDVFSWEVEGKELIPVDKLTPDALFVNATIRGWLMSMDYEQRITMVDSLFKLLSYGNVERASDIFLPKNIRQYMKLISTDENIRRILSGEFANLLEAAKKARAAGDESAPVPQEDSSQPVQD